MSGQLSLYIFIFNSLIFVMHAGRSSIINHVAYYLAYRLNIYLLQDIYMQNTFTYIHFNHFLILLCTYLELRRTIINVNSAFTLFQLLLFWQCV